MSLFGLISKWFGVFSSEFYYSRNSFWGFLMQNVSGLMKNCFCLEKLIPFQKQLLDFFILSGVEWSGVEKNHIRKKHGFHNQPMCAILLNYESDRKFPDTFAKISSYAHEMLVTPFFLLK